MLQKDASNLGLRYGDAKKLRILKNIRDHVSVQILNPEERVQMDDALAVLEKIGDKYKAVYQERCRQSHEEYRKRLEERRFNNEEAA